MSEPTVARLSTRTALVMIAFSVVFTGLMAFTYESTREAIDASAREETMRKVADVLPPASYDNDLLQDAVKLGPTPALGLNEGGTVYRARSHGAPAALVLEANAPDGYSGQIGLIVAVRADGSLSGVRVTRHKETPGLGDYIDPAKDRSHGAPWITQFNDLSLARLPLERWKVKKDGGDFAYHTGATISARAVTNAVARTMQFAAENRDRLFTAETGSALAPEGAAQ